MTTLGCLSSPKPSKLCDTTTRPVRTRRSKPQHGRNAVMVRNYAYGSNHHGSRLTDIHPQTLTRRPQQPHGCTPGNSGT